MAQHLQILKPLVVFVPIAVVNAKPGLAPVVVATLAPTDPLHKPRR